MIEQRFKAPVEPLGHKLGDEIRNLMDNGAGGFHISYDHGTHEVVIEYGNWANIDLEKIQVAVSKHKPTEATTPPLKTVHKLHIGGTVALVAYEILRALGVLH